MISPPKCFPCGVRDKECLIPASPKPQDPELGPVPSHSLHVLSHCCCHHKLETHPRGSRKPVSWRGGCPGVILRIVSLTPLFSVPSVDGAAAGVCVRDQLTPTAQPWAGGGGLRAAMRWGFPELTRNFRSQWEPKPWGIRHPQTLWIRVLSPKPERLCPILAKFLRGKGGDLG